MEGLKGIPPKHRALAGNLPGCNEGNRGMEARRRASTSVGESREGVELTKTIEVGRQSGCRARVLPVLTLVDLFGSLAVGAASNI